MDSLILTPTVMILNDKTTALPSEIVIILPNGHSYQIEEVMAHLVKLDEAKPKRKALNLWAKTKHIAAAPKRFGQSSKRFAKAIKTTLEELDAEQQHNQQTQPIYTDPPMGNLGMKDNPR
jgi:hypothetical protein